ncbi:TPA: hypothetical protein DCZ31_00515 [Patescibacteria group bacterium]|nr:hypothetical protein [Candidatus Gracilibacteria bacterium]
MGILKNNENIIKKSIVNKPNPWMISVLTTALNPPINKYDNTTAHIIITAHSKLIGEYSVNIFAPPVKFTTTHQNIDITTISDTKNPANFPF